MFSEPDMNKIITNECLKYVTDLLIVETNLFKLRWNKLEHRLANSKTQTKIQYSLSVKKIISQFLPLTVVHIHMTIMNYFSQIE